MREEFEKLVAAGKLNRHHIEPLARLAAAGFCVHRSWGCGKIVSVDTVFGRFLIDFPSRPAHAMDLTFAAESLKPIPSDHVLARKNSELGMLRQMAALHHLDLIKLVLKSYGGKATLDQIQQVLVPDVIADDWKKWWEVAKRELKKDGHFVVPMKKSDPIIYQEKEVSLANRFLADIRAAKGLKARVAVAQEMLKNIGDLEDKVATATEAISLLTAEIASHQRTQPALALEGIFVRDDIRAACEVPPQEGDITSVSIWAQHQRPAPILEALPAAKHKRALQSFKEANPQTWHDSLLISLNNMSTKLSGEVADLLIEQGKLQQLKDVLARVISQHTANSDVLLWLGKERSDTFADILGPEVFRAMLTAMERDQFNEKKSNKLRDYILDDQDLLVELIESADIEVIKDLTRALQLSPSFDDMDKRSLLARIVKHFPVVQSLISGEHTRQDAPLVVSWDSLERRKNEYNELVQKKIPANSKEIAIARSYGDLRENHEYKAAKEMQKILMRRKGELESQLVRARGSDFANPRTDAVNIGTRVKVTELGDQHLETYTILGAWDFDAQHHIISYLSPIAQSMVGKKVGDEVEFETESGQKRYRIEAIEPAQPIPAAPTAPPTPPPTQEPTASASQPAAPSPPAHAPM